MRKIKVLCGGIALLFLFSIELSAELAVAPTLLLTTASTVVSYSSSNYLLSSNEIDDYEKLKRYVAKNAEFISSDIAKGRGETLNTIAVILHIQSEQRARFMSTLQKNFDSIYPNGVEDAETAARTIACIAYDMRVKG